MAWVNYTNFSLVIEKNDVEIERGNYSGFLLGSDQVAWVNNDIEHGGSYLDSMSNAYYKNGSGTRDYAMFEGAAANTSPMLKTEGITQLLTNVGDVLRYYNSEVGPRYSILLKRTTDSGGYKRLTWGVTLAGATTWLDTDSYDGTSGTTTRGIVIGVLRNGYAAYPFYLLDVHDNNPKAHLHPWNLMAKATFNSTWKYNYFFIFSNEWQPPTPPTPSTDPYAGGGTSTGTDTGTGTFDDTSDAIADPSAPTLSPSIGSFVNQYVVSANALSNFGTWLYSGGNIFDNLAKVFQSPMEAIINVGILPYKPTFDPNAYVDIKVGGLNSNVQARKITDNYEVVDMGTIDFNPFYGSALDYNPYTKCYIYLPYCGTFPLNVDEIMGHKISLKYYCDSLSGDCVAVISDEERVLEQFRGNIFIQIPITARDFSSIYTNALNSAISLAAGIATVAATGGVSAPVAVGMGTSMASNAMNSKTHYSRSGGFSGVAGFMSVQKPYVMITIPRQCLPDKQNEMQGYPLFVTKRLGDFSGFTKVYEIHLDGLDCTDAEAKEIYELLKGGVVL